MLKNLINWLKALFCKKTGQQQGEKGTTVPKKIQFILKYRENQYTDEGGYNCSGMLESGLFNSARFIVEMLNEHPSLFDAEIVHVEDNNAIDREVTRFRPDIVVIEAYWVVPEKFEVLHKLHPNVKWVIRNHSKSPFLANEGIAFDWSMRYTDYPNVYVSSNSEQANNEIAQLVYNHHNDWSLQQAKDRCPFLPNYYPIHRLKCDRHDYKPRHDELHIGCFGAVRPLKNHVIQAIAAIKFADSMGKKLYFHINSTRLENAGANQILKNLKMIFNNMNHDLVEHTWMKHDDFLQLVGTMDFGLQVSYSETFNIVSADMISQGVPVIVSDEVDWIDGLFYADPNNSDDIVEKLRIANIYSRAQHWELRNQANLEKYNKNSFKCWEREIQRLTSRH
jgi:hypothetical protein